MEKYTILKEYAKENQIGLSEYQLQQFGMFEHYLLEKNKVMNLTSIEMPEDVEIKHFIDSISAAPEIKTLVGDKFRLIDVGCGAGFPGIPLKIIFNESEFLLLDSLNKRINFINECKDLLKLEKITGIAGRAEEIGHGPERESFDICVSRAVAQAPVLLEYCLPFVRTGGYCILYKSGNYAEELEMAEGALLELGGAVEKVKTLRLPKTGDERCLIVIKKEKAAPDKYPRRPGKPSKSPIKNPNKESLSELNPHNKDF